jgi:hypothetical protein
MLVLILVLKQDYMMLLLLEVLLYMEDFLIKRGIPRPNFNSLIRFGRVAPIIQ